jgi:hypothetical protein
LATLNADSRKAERHSLWPWLLGLPLLVAMVGMIATAVFLGSRGNQNLAQASAVADRDDPHWRIDDLLAHRESVPDSENSALILAEVRAMLPENWPSASKPSGGGPVSRPAARKPTLDQLTALPDYVRMDDALTDAIREDLNGYTQAVQTARRVADHPRGRHELQIGPAVIDTLLPATQAARDVARLLQSDAAIRAHDRDADGAIDSCRALLNTGRSIGDEPFLISQLVRIAIGRTATSASRRVLGQGEPSEAALARLQTLVLDESGQPLILYAMRGERATMEELIRRISRGKVPLSALDGSSPKSSSAVQSAATSFAGLFVGGQRAIALEWMNEAVAIARRPPAEQATLWKDWETKISGVARSRFGRFTAMLPLLLAPGMSGSSSAFLRYQADLGATAIVIAAERHRRKTGNWPTSISAIDRDILPTAPVDPFTGGAFHMERHDGQLVIYSVGPNLEDEHGAEPKRGVNRGPDDVSARAWDVSLRARNQQSVLESAPIP